MEHQDKATTMSSSEEPKMNSTEANESSAAPLINQGSRRSLSPLRQSDWGFVLSATELEMSGWRVLSPQRYALLSLVLLGLGGLYTHPGLILGGLLLIIWVTRRAHIEVSAERGCLLSFSLCGLTYSRLHLPLWTPLNLERHGAVTTMWLGSLESSFHIFELCVCHTKRADELAALFHEGVRRAQTSRFVLPPSPQASSSGDWQVSLIEILPLLSGPRAIYSFDRVRLTWWAPSSSALYVGLTLLLLSPFSIIVAGGEAWPLVMMLAIALSLLFGLREELSLSSEQWVWSRRWFSVLLSHQRWSPEVNASLISDPIAPHGRHVLLYDTRAPQSCKLLGHSWDSDWIWSQITAAKERL